MMKRISMTVVRCFFRLYQYKNISSNFVSYFVLHRIHILYKYTLCRYLTILFININREKYLNIVTERNAIRHSRPIRFL